MEKAGYVYIYLTNEGNSTTPVYFDDFTVNVQESKLMGTYLTYPFGAEIASQTFERQRMPENRYRFQGKELQKELGIDLYDFGSRLYDPFTGRWFAVDPQGEKRPHHSSFMAMGNNPLINVDPDGEFFLGTIITAVGDAFKTAFFDGGLDPTSSGARREAWQDYDPTSQGTPTNNAFKIDIGGFQGSFGQILSRWTWELPQTLFGKTFSHGLNMAGKVNDVNYFRGATVLDSDIEGGAFTVGSYIIGPEGFKPDFRDHLFVHEYGHYIQSQRLGPFYLPLVALPSVTDYYLAGTSLHHTRWYEANASKLGANYFDSEFGKGAKGYHTGSPDHFDKTSFVTGSPSPYFNPRMSQKYGYNVRNEIAHPIEAKFHWTDIPINLLWNGGLGLLGFVF